tara:strand:- start:188 stop:520 length:333 start_codon:yes stop_codon:yes gene_type:complete
MSENYTPDNWVVVKITKKGETFYKVLAGWSGGYLHGDSWRINSGVTEVKIEDGYYLFFGYSGSVYKCHKDSYTIKMSISGLLANLERQAEDNDDMTVDLLPKDTDWLNLL